MLAHRLVHLLHLARDVPEFSVDRSWLLAGSVRWPVAVTLMMSTVVTFGLAALAV